MTAPSNIDGEKPKTASFAETALAGENERRRVEPFDRPARIKFKRHVLLFVLVNVFLGGANYVLFPDRIVFYILTIVWAFVLADNFIWAYVVDPDRDVAERADRRADREARDIASQLENEVHRERNE